MRCSGFPGRAAAHDLVEELLLALVQVGAQLDEIIRPQVDDAVVHLLVVVLAALLGTCCLLSPHAIAERPGMPTLIRFWIA